MIYNIECPSSSWSKTNDKSNIFVVLFSNSIVIVIAIVVAGIIIIVIVLGIVIIIIIITIIINIIRDMFLPSISNCTYALYIVYVDILLNEMHMSVRSTTGFVTCSGDYQ